MNDISITPYIQLGIPTLIIFAIGWPLIRLLMNIIKEKDALISGQNEKYQQLHEKTISILTELQSRMPEAIVNGVVDRMKQVYNPDIYQRGDKAYKKLLRQKRKTK